MASIERLKSRLLKRFDFCNYCQPWDEGEAVWIHGDKTEIDDVLQSAGIPEPLWYEVLQGLSCPNCGAPISRGDAVGVKTQAESEDERQWVQWHKQFDKSFKEFSEHLEKFPYLGMKHRVGKKIFKTITSAQTIAIKEETWCRARKPDGALNFSATDMVPPLKPLSEGRFNHYGQRVFYLAEGEYTAASEALDEDSESIAWIQSFKIKDILKVLNLESYEYQSGAPYLTTGLSSKISAQKADLKSPWKPQYFIPRFIADCARKHGLNGIKFRSSKTSKYNLVLFSWQDKSIVPVGSLRIYELKRSGNRENY